MKFPKKHPKTKNKNCPEKNIYANKINKAFIFAIRERTVHMQTTTCKTKIQNLQFKQKGKKKMPKRLTDPKSVG